MEGKTKSSTKEIFGVDIDTYRKWIESQRAPEIYCSIIDIHHLRPISSFDISDDEQLEEAFDWKSTQPFLKEVRSQKGTKFTFLDYQLQFILAYQFLKLNEKRHN